MTATGGVSGTFASLVDNTNLPANFTSSLSYDANDAYLNVRLGYTTPSGLNANQQAVANTLTNFFKAAGGIPLVFGTLSPSGLSQAWARSGAFRRCWGSPVLPTISSNCRTASALRFALRKNPPYPAGFLCLKETAPARGASWGRLGDVPRD